MQTDPKMPVKGTPDLGRKSDQKVTGKEPNKKNSPSPGADHAKPGKQAPKSR